MSETNSLKNIATSFLKLLVVGAVDEAYANYVDNAFIHHNQHHKGDRESLKLGMQQAALKFTDMQLEVKSVLQEGDRVTTYSHIQSNLNNMDVAVFHMFKFKNDKIIELWDVGQQIIKDSPNENGFF
ncbi:nuclear transport factor 2 family protein [Solimicrobium silvestre]|uniref:SnoaL-like domain n=1 Tax=Solimicrobium silvestre TaxID=2099400 RepID=A0A2S9GXD5_9BURK|nr:ester cyclase [Solimicrobium silvestre]PRC92370.1 SnoaL-like domain [Solimicrobium silvestre]